MVKKKIIDSTGAELRPGDPENCQGNGKDPRFEICCDECDFYLDCFPGFVSDNLVGVLADDVDDKEARRERLEDLLDLKAAEHAMEEYRKNPVTYTIEEIEKMLEEDQHGQSDI